MLKTSVVLKNRGRSPEIIKTVRDRCSKLKTYGFEKLKCEVHLYYGRGGYRATVSVTGKNLRLNASERRILPLEQALHAALTKVERQLARSASRRTYRRPLLSRQAKVIQLNPYLETRPKASVPRRQVKAA